MNNSTIKNDTGQTNPVKSDSMPDSHMNLVRERYHQWSSSLNSASLNAAYAIIAANWAVNVNTKIITSNRYALWSVRLCVILIGLNILFTGIETHLLKRQLNILLNNKINRDAAYFPFNAMINYIALILRGIKIIFPIIAGALFILGLYRT